MARCRLVGDASVTQFKDFLNFFSGYESCSVSPQGIPDKKDQVRSLRLSVTVLSFRLERSLPKPVALIT